MRAARDEEREEQRVQHAAAQGDRPEQGESGHAEETDDEKVAASVKLIPLDALGGDVDADAEPVPVAAEAQHGRAQDATAGAGRCAGSSWVG